MNRPLVVQKYGGTSVGSPEKLSQVATRIGHRIQAGHQLVVIVSAMGQTTDHLVTLAQALSGNALLSDAYYREYDQLVATGETVSAALLAIALQAAGYKAVSLTGAQAGIKTEQAYSRAKIQAVDLSRVYQELAEHDAVIITGFQGVNARNDVTTIGRGGSDTSAVVMAAALNLPVCEIYTDVDGVYTADPRYVKQARKLALISYDDMLEFSSLGATVMHPRAVECAKLNQITLSVRSALTDDPGTEIKEIPMELNKPVTGVTRNDNTTQFTIRNLPDTPGTAATLFNALTAISVDMIVQSTQDKGTNTISFTVDADDTAATEAIMTAYTQSPTSLTVNTAIAKVSVVGVGMISRPGVAATVFSTLGNAGINIHLIATSEIKISCVIDRARAIEAVQLLHHAFALDT